VKLASVGPVCYARPPARAVPPGRQYRWPVSNRQGLGTRLQPGVQPLPMIPILLVGPARSSARPPIVHRRCSRSPHRLVWNSLPRKPVHSLRWRGIRGGAFRIARPPRTTKRASQPCRPRSVWTTHRLAASSQVSLGQAGLKTAHAGTDSKLVADAAGHGRGISYP